MKAVETFLRRAAIERLRQPIGHMKHPFTDPSAGYEDIMWDWDAYFNLYGLCFCEDLHEKIGPHVRGCVDNFLERQGVDGSVPYANMPNTPIQPDRVRAPESERNTCKPLLAQFALMADRTGSGGDEWLAKNFPKLCLSVDHWYETQLTRFGVLTWRSHRGSGADNHPAYFQRPHDTVADPYLNSMMVMECRALAEIAKRIGKDPDKWEKRAEDLAAAVEKYLWDPIDGTYYAIDVGVGDPGKVRTPSNWVVPLKFRSWVMVMPLWAKIAAPERAERVLREHLMPHDQLGCPHGLRSLAKVEPSYQIFADYNPSDWLGPVWVISTFLAWKGMKNYGFDEAARQLANGHVAMLTRDLEANGCLHEYYDPESGEGLTHPGFINWNTCAIELEQSL